jgi:hypothetical protein
MSAHSSHGIRMPIAWHTINGNVKRDTETETKRTLTLNLKKNLKPSHALIATRCAVEMVQGLWKRNPSPAAAPIPEARGSAS